MALTCTCQSTPMARKPRASVSSATLIASQQILQTIGSLIGWLEFQKICPWQASSGTHCAVHVMP